MIRRVNAIHRNSVIAMSLSERGKLESSFETYMIFSDPVAMLALATNRLEMHTSYNGS